MITVLTVPAKISACKVKLWTLRPRACLSIEGKVDAIYIDPPYNSGARDWKYNNDYVDRADQYRHSKWLSMMKRRLELAKRLLRPDGILIVTVDENEVGHLGVLLEGIFPEYLRHMVTAVINPKGTKGYSNVGGNNR